MKTEAGALTTVSEPTVAAAVVRPAPAPAAPAPKTTVTAPPNLRLVIEQDRASGTFVYKTLDPITGEVILQLPREEVLKAIHSGDYSAGDLFKTQA